MDVTYDRVQGNTSDYERRMHIQDGNAMIYVLCIKINIIT